MPRVHKHFGDRTRRPGIGGVDFEARLGNLRSLLAERLRQDHALIRDHRVAGSKRRHGELSGATLAVCQPTSGSCFAAKNVGFVFQQFIVASPDGRRKRSGPADCGWNERTEAVGRAKALLDQLGSTGGVTRCPPRCLEASSKRVAIGEGSSAQAAAGRLRRTGLPRFITRPGAVMKLVAANAVHPDRAAVVVTHDSRVFHFADVIAHMGRRADRKNGEKREEGDSVMREQFFRSLPQLRRFLR